MKRDFNNDTVPKITFENLSKVPGLSHAVFTRRGGVSGPPYESLNTSWSNGDSPDAVRENISRIRKASGLERLVSSRQFHGDSMHFIDSWTLKDLKEMPPLLIAPPGDALATNLPGVGLVIKIADCQSIMLADPRSRVIANIHSGWRGSVQNIAGKTVKLLAERYGLNPKTTLAAVSPSLGPCCAEFTNYRTELPEDFLRFQVRPEYFNFWEITREQLESAEIRSENIEFSARCTVCEKEEFFSYRREHSTGRMASVIGWEETTRSRA